MHKIQIISATNDKNLDLANSIQSTLTGVAKDVDKTTASIDCPDIISLESLQLPLFSFGVKANEEVLNGLVSLFDELRSIESGTCFKALKVINGIQIKTNIPIALTLA